MTSHMKRWLTGVVGVPLIFALLFYGSEELFSLVVVVLILAAAAEYNRLAFGAAFRGERAAVLLAAFLIPAAFTAGDPQYALFMIVFSAMSVFFSFLLRIKDEAYDLSPVGKAMGGVVYIPLLLSYFIALRHAANGSLWISLALAIAFGGDIAAYYAGTMLGRRKLLPLVSPGKTVAGAVGGYAGSILGALLFQQLFFTQVPAVHVLVLGIAGSTLGQLGDLCESAVKRTAGVKDSGSLLPGHGGLLDRLDSIAFIIPFVYYYQRFLISASPR